MKLANQTVVELLNALLAIPPTAIAEHSVVYLTAKVTAGYLMKKPEKLNNRRLDLNPILRDLILFMLGKTTPSMKIQVNTAVDKASIDLKLVLMQIGYEVTPTHCKGNQHARLSSLAKWLRCDTSQEAVH